MHIYISLGYIVVIFFLSLIFFIFLVNYILLWRIALNLLINNKIEIKETEIKNKEEIDGNFKNDVKSLI